MRESRHERHRADMRERGREREHGCSSRETLNNNSYHNTLVLAVIAGRFQIGCLRSDAPQGGRVRA